MLPVSRRSRNYVILSDQSMYIDQQPLKLQESPEVSEGRRTSFTHRLPHEYPHHHHLTTYATIICRTTATFTPLPTLSTRALVHGRCCIYQPLLALQ